MVPLPQACTARVESGVLIYDKTSMPAALILATKAAV